MYNAPGSETIFQLGYAEWLDRASKNGLKNKPVEATLVHGVQWGKPIINTKMPLAGFINHNIQLPKCAFGTNIVSKFFILHLTQFSVQQRIRTNINKLIARDFTSINESIESILLRPITEVMDNNIKIYVREIEWLSNNNFNSPILLPMANEIKIIPGQNLCAFSEVEISLFKQFIGVNRDSVLKALDISFK